MGMSDLTGWDLILDTMKQRCQEASQLLRDTQLRLECTQACVEIYGLRGVRHPSTFGGGDSTEYLTECVTRYSDDLNRWEEALRLAELAAGMGVVVREARS